MLCMQQFHTFSHKQFLKYEYSQNIILAELLRGSESPLFYMNSIKA